MRLGLDRLVVPGAMLATAIALTAIVGTCGRPASGGYPLDTRDRAMIAVGSCDTALANMAPRWRANAPGLRKLLATSRQAAHTYLQTNIASIVSYLVVSCESARTLLREAYEAGAHDMRVREDGGRMMLQLPRVNAAQQAYLELEAALAHDTTGDLTPLVDALGRALR